MRNHLADLLLNIKQATDGLNKLVSILYDIQDLDVMKAQGVIDIKTAHRAKDKIMMACKLAINSSNNKLFLLL